MGDLILKIILGLIGLLALSSIVIYIKSSRKTDKSKTKTKQVKNIVFGDQAGRDINKKNS